MTRQVTTVFLILISAILSLSLSTFTNFIVILTLPGLLFGLALTIPLIHPNYKTHRTELITIIAYLTIWVISCGLYVMLQFITPLQSNKIPYIIFGIISGFGITITFDFQFGFKNKLTGILTGIVLSIIAVLLGDFIFPNPHDKELNIGKLVAIWQIMVGFGLIINGKTPANSSYTQ